MAASEASKAPSYRLMLGVVIILGVLIVLAVGALIAAAIWRAAATARAPSEAPFVTRLNARSAHIESADGVGDRILIRLSGGDQGDEVVVLDAATGRILGRILAGQGP